MKKACLYIRVSTDEQADKGFSQRDQAERLQIHCAKNNIEVTKIIFEDYSAKTFIRPEWTKLLLSSENQKAKTLITSCSPNGIGSAGIPQMPTR